MNTSKTTSFEENVDNELINQHSQTFRLTILISLLIIFSTIIILWWIKHRQDRLRRHGECLLLCGISNSVKTLLFNRLTSSIEKRTFNSTTTNHGIMTLDYLSTDRPIKRVHVIDIPDSLRIRQRDLNTYKTSAKAIIFVIDSITIEKELKRVSDYLYDIFHEKYFRNQRLPLLIFCNKQDLNNKDQNLQTICHLLEHELTMKRKTFLPSISLHQKHNEINDNNNDDDIGRLGKETFEFNDIKDIRIEFVEGSVLCTGKQNIDKQYKNKDLNDTGSNLFRVHQWIARIWFK